VRHTGNPHERIGGIGSAARIGALRVVSLAGMIGLTAAGSPSPLPACLQAPAAADTTRVVHLLSRATFGVRSLDLAEVLEIGTEAWLDAQLHPERIDDSPLEERLAAYPAADMSVGELYASYPPPQVVRARLGNPDSIPRDELRRMRRKLGIQSPNRILFDLAGAKLQRAVYSERQLEEVMTNFWFNHFNVFFAKGPDRWLIGDYEREAIRPHVFGSFEEMLVATASHPAMLVYLDNWRSAVPDSLNPRAAQMERARARLQRLSPHQRERFLRSRGIGEEQLARIQEAMRRGGRERGLNENYARELLELHTLGVDGGYTQQDVVEVARAFTGWTIELPGRGRGLARGRNLGRGRSEAGRSDAGRFVFREEWHDPGEKSVLGRRLPAGQGVRDGLEVLHLVARHPSTARHIATKLAEAFVSDDPPPELVDELASVFLETEGDLRQLTRTLFLSEEFYAAETVGGKLKSPFELVASALRATDAEVGPSRGLIEQLRALGQLPYMSSPPTGYPEASEDWTSAAALLQRMNLGLALATGHIDHVRVSPSLLAPDESLTGMLEEILPGVDTTELAATIEAELAGMIGAELAGTSAARRRAEPRELALGLILGSPEFQRH
jgi:uncharacterized protein (DUF1800 family)